MTELIDMIIRSGFDRVTVLDGRECGLDVERLILCFVHYIASLPSDDVQDAVIHPYYPVSQQAYLSARNLVREASRSGLDLKMDSTIRVKAILDRLPFLKRGRNTLSYLEPFGSRFHVQILTSGCREIQITDHLEKERHPFMCGACRRCRDACPTGAITEDGFEKEKCLRFWMLGGTLPPDFITEKIGNRLLGCDDCEACCPMNVPGTEPPFSVSAVSLLDRKNRPDLSEMIGKNYAIPNRVTAQTCIAAASIRREEIRPALEAISRDHPSPLCRKAALKALEIREKLTQETSEKLTELSISGE